MAQDVPETPQVVDDMAYNVAKSIVAEQLGMTKEQFEDWLETINTEILAEMEAEDGPADRARTPVTPLEVCAYIDTQVDWDVDKVRKVAADYGKHIMAFMLANIQALRDNLDPEERAGVDEILAGRRRDLAKLGICV